MSRWHPFLDEPRAAAAARLAVLGGQMAVDRFERRAVRGREDGQGMTEASIAICSRLVDDIVSAFPGDGVLAADGQAMRSDAEPAHWWGHSSDRRPQ